MEGTAGDRSGGWAYVSIVSALPGLSVDLRRAIALQLVLFEGAALVLAVWYDLWSALPFGTVAIFVATAGSYLMVQVSDSVRRARPPERYRRYLFDSSIDVVMAVVAFVLLGTYLLAADGPGPSVLERALGDPMPAPAVSLALVVAWDLCYRIGTGWWASVTGLWRTLAFGEQEATDRAAYVRADLLTIAFAGLQLLLVPFLVDDPLLAVAVLGHVGAVALVSGLSVALQRAR